MRYFTPVHVLCYCLFSSLAHAEATDINPPASPAKTEAATSSTQASEQVLANVKKLLKTRQCAECDLRHADLSKLDLAGVELLDADLRHANLSQSHFDGANLAGVNFSHANLSASKLDKAEIHGANFYEADLTQADISLEEVLKRGAFSEKTIDTPEKRPVFRGIRG